ncbi:tryptophan-rich sensory protein [Arthrobacter sp. MI7-26]|uniref:TspO/MBR family protein n=1 Tax=Arthrobacter sp. MI7-26 TaxID=2993653 RepID=UPI002249118E|nr:TspO/MBR family protein [Arthrobacter sp. MI7-26]MCX2749633.1 tryptophan-rich sensory protein [Arthrobacter sp. MI7-26]
MSAESQQTSRPVKTARTGLARQVTALLGFLVLSYAVSLLGSMSILDNASGWYATATKAPWAPPGWVFGSVWTVLYTAMAVAPWLVWRQRSAKTRGAMTAYGIQMALNLAWAPTFFGMYPVWGDAALWLALLLIVALFLAVTATVILFGPISTTAGLLMLPYISWIVFSASLNFYAAANN